MTLRKSSLPYPRTPTSPNQPNEPFVDSARPDLDVNSADLPPVPSFKTRSPNASRTSPFMESDNPWGDTRSGPNIGTDKALPSILQAGGGRQGGRSPQRPPNLSATLNPGQPGAITPRSSSESQRSRDFWDEDQNERNAPEGSSAPVWRSEAQEHAGSLGVMNPNHSQAPSPEPPTAPTVKRKPVAQAHISPQHTGTSSSSQHEFASNNPFRREVSAERAQADQPHWEDVVSLDKGKGKEVLGDSPAFLPQSSFQLPGLEVDEHHWSQQALDTPPRPAVAPPPVPTPLSPFSQQPPLIPVSSEQRPGENPWQSEASTTQLPLRHAAPYSDTLLGRGEKRGSVSLGSELSALPNASHAKEDHEYSFEDEKSRWNPLADEEPVYDQRSHKNVEQYQPHLDPPPSFGTSQSSASAQQNLLDIGDVQRPELPQRRKEPDPANRPPGYYEAPEGPPPAKPPRPSVSTNEATLAARHEQRNETYQIKHFNWFDHHAGQVRTSSMLTQNKNGPCPLLALVNALILGAKDDSQAALDNALRAREQVSLGLMIETLIDELLSGHHASLSGSLPDVDELNSFLLMLHTGMNANPRFVVYEEPVPNLMDARNSILHLPQSLNQDRKTGTFEQTQDVKLYSSFSVPLIHGWLPPRNDPAKAAFARSAPTYEDAQALQFGEEELEYKLSRGGLDEQEQQLWEDISSIKSFLRTYPTQLTPYGLNVIQESVFPGSFAILFRNDHFSTIFKHPETGQLFTLVTDAGYSDRDEIIWESLVDVNGQHSEFFSGDFRPVGNNVDPLSEFQDASSSQPLSINANMPTVASPISPQERQEQHDADFAMALQLQEEEDQASRTRRTSNQSAQQRDTGRGGTNNTETTNTTTNNNNNFSRLRPPQEARPLIPPRSSRSRNPGVNRPTDTADNDAPPTYDEAAKGRPYIPPLGSPLHPSADPSPGSSSTQLSGIVSAPTDASPSASAPAVRRPNTTTQQRRASAYNENSQQFVTQGTLPGSYPRQPSNGMRYETGRGRGVGRGRGRGQPIEDRDCIVM